MSSELELGRLDSGLVDKPVVYDAPEQSVKAVISKLDEVIARLNAIGAAVEAATDGNSLFTALDVASIKAEIKKLRFTL